MAKLAVDIHGGDFGPFVVIPSCLDFFRSNPQHFGYLFGNAQSYRAYVSESPANVEWIDTDELSDIERATPSKLLRKSGTSSIEIAYKALSNKDVDAIVSAEHTGVLLALSTKYGQLHSQLNRPVLASWLPTTSSETVMLDLGASFSATSDQLVAYAAVGIGLMRSRYSTPKVSLLNLGTEAFKGPLELRTAYQVLSQWEGIEFQGFIEANDLYCGRTHIVATDGFTGNTAIKSAEGALKLTLSSVSDQFTASIWHKLLGLVLKYRLKSVVSQLHPDNANGALVAGSDLIVIKSHGNARRRALTAALNRAVDAIESQSAERIWEELDKVR
ncbi:hypothetical protein QWZ13_11420 [Reinekea marina]|uniref:Phosphate acyltransferase n=1 Tax=Reinekea marina TaxID=1310421 RepID=A0ABV7WQ80_9GAMM|nr:hypothetical protein [Reinekea marina]MDN3649524.1 hypothetical protein [Reinekea marina]